MLCGFVISSHCVVRTCSSSSGSSKVFYACLPFPHLLPSSLLPPTLIAISQFNNTFAPYKTCPNAKAAGKADRSQPYVREWVSIYLADARERLSRAMIGKVGVMGEFQWTGEEVYEMMQMCAYEVRLHGYRWNVSVCCCSLTINRPLLSVTPSSAISLRKKNGRDSITRMFYPVSL